MALFHRSQVSFLFFIPLWIMLPFVLSGCNQDKGKIVKQQDSAAIIRQIDNINIPLLANATEQLVFARSSMESLETKRAAWKAVSEFYPEALPERKIAALELAYLQLGHDYRLADRQQCHAALNSYADIIANYRDDANVAAKALWYQGWIYSSLLSSPESGKEYYLEIIKKYPEATVEFLPPPPWLNLEGNRPEDAPKSPERTSLHWADLARLELVRTAANAPEAEKIAEEVIESSPDDHITGIVVRTLLTEHGTSGTPAVIAGKFLQKQAASGNFTADIITLLQNSETPAGREDIHQ